MNKIRNQPINTKLILSVILLIVLIFTFYTRFPLINSDSVHGFEAMNGHYWTGKWNTTLQYNGNTHLLDEKFLTWWSPGQYLAPLLFIKLLHLPLGIAVVLVNFLSTLLGTTGYFLVFKKYGFGPLAIWVSVLLILLSSPVLPAYYDYAGGECLNFMIFPWIIVLQNLLVRKFWKYVFPGLILFVSFICKLQMLIVVPPLLFLLVFIQKEDLYFYRMQLRMPDIRGWTKKYLPLFISVVPILLWVYFGFVSIGVTPVHSIKQFSLSPVNILFPVASPVTSISFFDSLNYYLSQKAGLYAGYLFIISIVVIACVIYVARRLNSYTVEKRKYIFLVFILYFFCITVFVVLYVKGTPIDFNTRHLKLSSFLLYPILVELALTRFNKPLVLGFFSLLGLFAIGNHIRLARVWTEHTSVTRSDFRLFKEDMPLDLKQRLDSLVHTKTLVISRFENRYSIDNQFIIPIMSNQDIRADLATYGYPLIFVDSLLLVNTSLK